MQIPFGVSIDEFRFIINGRIARLFCRIRNFIRQRRQSSDAILLRQRLEGNQVSAGVGVFLDLVVLCCFLMDCDMFSASLGCCMLVHCVRGVKFVFFDIVPNYFLVELRTRRQHNRHAETCCWKSRCWKSRC